MGVAGSREGRDRSEDGRRGVVRSRFKGLRGVQRRKAGGQRSVPQQRKGYQTGERDALEQAEKAPYIAVRPSTDFSWRPWKRASANAVSDAQNDVVNVSVDASIEHDGVRTRCDECDGIAMLERARRERTGQLCLE